MSSWKMSDPFTATQIRVLKLRKELENLLERNAYLTAQLESLQEDIRLAQQDLHSAIFSSWDPTWLDAPTEEDDDDSGN